MLRSSSAGVLEGDARVAPTMEPMNFADRLSEAVTRKRSQLVVGLDPRLDLLPMELRGEAVLGRAAAASSVARFCKGIVDAAGPYVVAVKPQTAFLDRKSTRLNSSHIQKSRMPSSA